MAERTPRAADVARRAREEMAGLTGRDPESVLAVERDENDGGGWKVTVEMLELRRVPSTTDLLGSYEVMLDSGGELVGYRRMRRYTRGQPDDGEDGR